MASPNLSEIITTTLRNRTKKLADNVTNNTALLSRLKERGNVKPFSGGRTIVQELEYDENDNFMWASGYDVLDISPRDVFTAAEFDLKLAYCSVSISGLEMLQNSGPEQVIDLLEARVKNAEKSMVNGLSTGIYSAGTANGGKQIGGLQVLVADDPTASTSVGGINQNTWTFWRNIVFDASTDGGTAATSTNIQSYMNQLYVQLVRGTDSPDLIPADNIYYRLYLESLQTIQRITNEKMASAGFTNIKYMNADVVLDGGIGGACPASRMYFLNTDYVFLRPHRDRDMVEVGDDRFSVNQDAMVKIVGWAGNMTTSGRKFQGLLKA
jgi:hypothetical protein